MIKYLAIFMLLVITASCGGTVEEKQSGSNSKPDQAALINESLSANPDYVKGSELVNRYQCTACHKTDENLTGPAYRKVAEKYAGAGDAEIAVLAKKIIDGGSGVWGPVPMTPHPNVNEEDAKMMVRYILMLKN